MAQHVVVEVERRVLDPGGVVESERHLDDAPTEGRRQVQSASHQRPQGLEAQASRCRRRIDDGQERHVHVVGRRLERDEGGVHTAEALHVATAAT